MNHTSTIVGKVGAKEISVSLQIVIAAVTENILENKKLFINIPLIQFIIKSFYCK